MMAELLWPNWIYISLNALELSIYQISMTILPFNKARTKAINRIGPHDKKILDLIISGMLGDFWADNIKGNTLNSVRFNIEQSISNTAYIHYLTLTFYKLGYCPRPFPTLIEKSIFKSSNPKQSTLTSVYLESASHNLVSENYPVGLEKRFNYKLTLFTFSNFNWIYESFYKTKNGKTVKIVPFFIADYLTPLGLANWVMQDASYQKGQGINIATNCFTYEECQFLANILTTKYKFKTSVIKTGKPDQWRISIWKESLPNLRKILEPYFIPEMMYKLGI